MLVLMAGLPGSGKSTLARTCAERLNTQRAGSAIILDKDELRAQMFAPEAIEYTRAQDDRVMSLLYDRAAEMLPSDPQLIIFIDGRPFARTYQLEHAIRRAAEVQTRWRILECVCTEATAQARLAESHIARDRDYMLRQRIAAEWQPIVRPKLLIDTEEPLVSCVARALAYLRE